MHSIPWNVLVKISNKYFQFRFLCFSIDEIRMNNPAFRAAINDSLGALSIEATLEFLITAALKWNYERYPDELMNVLIFNCVSRSDADLNSVNQVSIDLRHITQSFVHSDITRIDAENNILFEAMHH